MESLQDGIKREKDAVAVGRCPGPGYACMESSSSISVFEGALCFKKEVTINETGYCFLKKSQTIYRCRAVPVDYVTSISQLTCYVSTHGPNAAIVFLYDRVKISPADIFYTCKQ